MAIESNADISVVICTRDRADSLRQTLQLLATAERGTLRCEVVVVDNGSRDATRSVVETFAGQLPVRYLFEPRVGIYGKSRALNCALEAGGLGSLVAVLDDDMSVEAGWWQGVWALSRRWPQADVFTGRSRIIWPAGNIPAWALDPAIHGTLFSVLDNGTGEITLAASRLFSGNHFWFRSRVVSAGRRFPDTWLTEPHFMLQLLEEGFTGVSGPDAVADHRIQPALLDPSLALERAARTGQGIAEMRLCPCRASVRNSRRARAHPLAARVWCVAAWLGWCSRCWLLRRENDRSSRFGKKLVAFQRRANYREALKILWTADDYRVLGKRPPVCSSPP